MPLDRIDAEHLKTILERINAALGREKNYLSQLDSHIGDGDHGFGISNGFRIGYEKVDKSGGSIEDSLKTIGLSLIKEVGGASGTIFGSLFLGMAKAAKGHGALGLSELARTFEEGLALVKQRGKAELGDKTMVDALHPAVESLKQSAVEGLPVVEAFQRAAAAAKKGAEETKNMIGKKGRAKYFKEKSIGFQDAGATTVAVILAAMADGLQALESP